MGKIFRQRGIDRSNFSGRSEFIRLVHEKVQEAREKFPQAKFEYEIVFFKTGTTAGFCKGNANSLAFNLEFNTHAIKQNWHDMVTDTIPHEIAHMIETVLYGFQHRMHGPKWKKICIDLGGTGKRTHSYDMSKIKKKTQKFVYHATCGTEVVVGKTRHNRISDGKVYYLKSSKGKIDSGCFIGRRPL